MLSLFTILRRRLAHTGLRPGQVALTFDDGPNPKDNVTLRLLDVLQQHNITAGFCLIGRLVEEHPELTRAIRQAGHVIVNHTWSHTHPCRLSARQLEDEIDRCDGALQRALNDRDYRSACFRPPFGIVTPTVRRICRRRCLKPVLLNHYGWDTRVGPHNWQTVAGRLIDHALKFSGGLFVLHDGSVCSKDRGRPDWHQSAANRSWVPLAVERIVTELQAAGLQFVCPMPGQSAGLTDIADHSAAA